MTFFQQTLINLVLAEGESAARNSCINACNGSEKRYGCTFELSELIFKYLDHIIYIGEDIQRLVLNDFITEEEQRHKKSMENVA